MGTYHRFPWLGLGASTSSPCVVGIRAWKSSFGQIGVGPLSLDLLCWTFLLCHFPCSEEAVRKSFSLPTLTLELNTGFPIHYNPLEKGPVASGL